MPSRGTTLSLFALTLACSSGRPCGPYFAEAIFVAPQPLSRAELLAGKIGILSPGFYNVDRTLIYRVLAGQPLTPDERAQMQAASDRAEHTNQYPEPIPPGQRHWLEASAPFTNVKLDPKASPPGTEAPVPGVKYESYANCLDDAFETAARTLADHLRTHPADKEAIGQWVAAQQTVFSNCPGPAALPAAPAPGSPAWLQQDRAYQIAAAHFYRAEWEPAKQSFTAIAQDKGSPWHELAPYLVVRTLLRQASLESKADGPPNPALLRAAQMQLQAIVHGGGRYAAPAQALLNYVGLRLDPESAAARLGHAISTPDAHFQQDLTDLDFALDRLTDPAAAAIARKDDLVDWLLTTKSTDPANGAHALDRWHATHSQPWLVSAMLLAPVPPPDLLAAAAAVPRTSPAWLTVTYARLRHGDRHAELAALIPTLDKSESLSTVNSFRLLALYHAPTLDDFLAQAALQPAAYDEGDGTIDTTPDAAPDPKAPTMAGLPVGRKADVRFTPDAAAILNQQLPLSNLAEIVEQRRFPKQLQFELAMAVWTRAVLLDQPAVARTLTPVLLEGEPGWKPWLTAYDAAQTADDLRLAKLLALARFPSIRPYVNAGAGREEGFVAYSSYRDNWWCATMGITTDSTYSYTTSSNYGGDTNTTPTPAPPTRPAFVTAAMATLARQQMLALQRTGNAPAYFGRESLAWANAHPADPRAAELLAFAFRAMRNGCNLELSLSDRRKVFNLLHARYPKSEWARKYPAFESDSDN